MQIISSIGNMLNSITNGNILGKIGVFVGSALTAHFAPIVGLLITCFATTILDMIYGIRVARKQHKKITSGKNWRGTLVKLMDEFTIIGAARLIEMTTLHTDDVFVLTGGATIIIALTELWSILENLNTLNPDGPWKALSKFLKKKGEDYTGVELELDNDGNVKNIELVEEQ